MKNSNEKSKDNQKKYLVLDIDETIVSTSIDKNRENFDFSDSVV